MSLNGISQTYQPLSLNGINTGNFNNIYINGVLFDPTAVVPYTGATKTVDLGSNELKTSYVPTTGPDVINKTYSDANLVPYTGASSDVNLNGHALTTGNLSNPTNTSNSLASLITTGPILPLSGFSPSTVIVGNAFGPITNSGGIYQSTSIITSYFPSLNLGLLTAGAKYSITMSLKLVDTVNSNYLQLYASANGNYTLGGITLSLQASFPPNTTTYQTLTGTFTMPVGYPYLILLLNSGSSGTETVYWQTYSLLGMGSSIVSLVNPTNANDAVNKTYVDTATALLVPYIGSTADLQLASRNFTQTTGTVTTNGISQLNATASTVPIYDASKSLISSSIPSSYITGFTSDPQTQLNGKGGLASNNTWTGTNTFNNNLTLGDGYNAILAEIGYINQTYITSATPTTTGITAIAPTPTGTITFSTPTYTMTPSGASTFASFWSSATFTGTTRCFFNFTNMSLANAPSGATITVCQANTGNTAYITISSAIALPQSSPMFSGYFSPNTNASYVGQIFFLLSNVKFNPFSWTAFTYGYGTWTVQGNETVNGTLSVAGYTTLPQTSITASSLIPLTITHSGTFQQTCVMTSSSSDTALDIINTATSGRTWRLGSGGTGSGGGVGNFYIYDGTGGVVWLTISSSGLTTIKGNGTILGNLTVIGYANTGILTATYPGGSLVTQPTFTCSNNPPVSYPSRFWFINWASVGAYNNLVQAGDFLMVNLDAGTSSSPYYNQAGTVIGGWNQTAGIRVGTSSITTNGNILPLNNNTSSLGNYTNQYASVYAFLANHGELQLVNSSTFIRFVPDASCVYLECGTSSGGSPVNPSVVPIYFTGMYGGNPMGGFATNGNFGCGGITSPSYTLDMGGGSSTINVRGAGYNWYIAGNGLGYWDPNTRYGSGGSNWRMYGYSNLQIQGGTNASFSNGSCGFDANSPALGAIWNTVSPPTGNIYSWNQYGGGFTVFSNATAPSASQAGIGIGVYNNGTGTNNWIVSLSPGLAWLPLTIYNSQTTFTYYGSACGYTVGGGGANVSDAREKHTINDYPSEKSLAKILKLKPKTYKRIYYDKNGKGEDHTPAPDHVKEKVHIGLLAQEVLDVNPGCVSTFINESIKSDTETGERYGICYDDFIVHLIGAVQEQQKTITSLQSQLTAQAQQIAELTSLVNQLLKK